MFDRELFEVVRISKSAVKLNDCPGMHLFPVPPLKMLMLVLSTAATRTSLAVHWSVWVAPLAVNSFCKQFCADAGAAMTAIAKTVQQATKSVFPLLKFIPFLLF